MRGGLVLMLHNDVFNHRYRQRRIYRRMKGRRRTNGSKGIGTIYGIWERLNMHLCMCKESAGCGGWIPGDPGKSSTQLPTTNSPSRNKETKRGTKFSYIPNNDTTVASQFPFAINTGKAPHTREGHNLRPFPV